MLTIHVTSKKKWEAVGKQAAAENRGSSGAADAEAAGAEGAGAAEETNERRGGGTEGVRRLRVLRGHVAVF